MSKRRHKSYKSAIHPANNVILQTWSNRLYPFCVAVLLLIIVACIYFWAIKPDPESRLRQQIETYAKTSQFAKAEASWQKMSEIIPDCIRPQDQIDWATSALRADHPGAALSVLQDWKRDNPDKPDGWLLILDLTRILGNSDLMMADVSSLLKIESVNRNTAVLVGATLGLLTDLDQQDVRSRLKRWTEKEPNSPLALSSLLLRYAENPLPEDPSRDVRINLARSVATQHPKSIPAMTSLIETLFNGGFYEEAIQVLESWPVEMRAESAWHRLQGRRLQDADGKHTEAVLEFQAALKFNPHDWKTRYRLARALAAAGRIEESRNEARSMSLIRESLEPNRLAELLKSAIPKGRSPEPERLISLLQSIELTTLANAWRNWQADQKLLKFQK